MGLSVSEKKELRTIIANRLTTRMDALKAGQKELLADLTQQARSTAHVQLGVADEMQRLDALTNQKAALEAEIDATEQAIYDRLKPIEHYLYNSRPERIKQIVSRVQKPIEESLFQATPLGQQVARLTAEKNRLDETIWAATSARQVSEIFQALNTLLDERPTALEQAAHELQHPDD